MDGDHLVQLQPNFWNNVRTVQVQVLYYNNVKKNNNRSQYMKGGERGSHTTMISDQIGTFSSKNQVISKNFVMPMF